MEAIKLYFLHDIWAYTYYPEYPMKDPDAFLPGMYSDVLQEEEELVDVYEAYDRVQKEHPGAPVYVQDNDDEEGDNWVLFEDDRDHGVEEENEELSDAIAILEEALFDLEKGYYKDANAGLKDLLALLVKLSAR